MLTPDDIVRLLLALAALLTATRFAAEASRWLGQPAVVGEIVAGVLLGPTVLGRLWPDASAFLFPPSGSVAVVLDGLASLAIVLFLLVAGLEVDLSTMLRQGKTALSLAAFGLAVPFGLGFATALALPDMLDLGQSVSAAASRLFFATVLAMSALPIIAKTLMDLAIFRSDFGMTVIAAALIKDLVGWTLFALLLGSVAPAPRHGIDLGSPILPVLLVPLLGLTAGRWLVHRLLPWVQAHLSWPGGVLGFVLSTGLFAAALTEALGVHAIFGAFLAGIAIGDSSHLRRQTRRTIEEFVDFLFAPLFFGSIGLHLDFASQLDVSLCLLVLAVACAGKLAGCRLGGWLVGLHGREAWAASFALNTHGSMEIILGLLALRFGLIGERLLVALVIMAIATSLMSGPMLQKLLGRRAPRRLVAALAAKAFVPRVQASSREAALHELGEVAARAAGLDPAATVAEIQAREQLAPTGIGDGVALPHARLSGLAQPVVAVGLSPEGIDFDAPDGRPAHIVFLLLTPLEDDGAQLELMAQISRAMQSQEARARLTEAKNATELRAALQAVEAA